MMDLRLEFLWVCRSQLFFVSISVLSCFTQTPSFRVQSALLSLRSLDVRARSEYCLALSETKFGRRTAAAPGGLNHGNQVRLCVTIEVAGAVIAAQ